jgi:hypothetical protein
MPVFIIQAVLGTRFKTKNKVLVETLQEAFELAITLISLDEKPYQKIFL